MNAQRKHNQLRETPDRVIRVAMVRAGVTLNQWAKSRGHKPSTVYDAIAGRRKGVKSIQIVREVQQFLKPHAA
jgi:gp16 family phage-associated protein